MNKGIYIKTEEHKRKISLSRKGKALGNQNGFRKGHIPYNKGKKTGIIPISAFQKGDRFWLGKERKNMRGEKHFNWKGGISRNKHSLSNPEYRQWRSNIFQRDNWTCQTCQVKGLYFEAHHIKSWAKYPELRYDLENGITLCCECHKLTNNYKGKVNKK